MKVAIVDDEPIALDNLNIVLKEFSEITEIVPFNSALQALDWFEGHTADMAFLDIQMHKMDGLALAKRLKELSPKCAVVFITGYSEYAVQAFELHASGYLLKPVRPDHIRRELDHILNSVPTPVKAKNAIQIQCFGNFEVFSDGVPVKFERSKTKELMAYLVDRRGASVNTGELCAILWENQPDTISKRSQLRTLISDLTRTLKCVGAEDAIIKRRNNYSVNIHKVDCDYYAFLKREPDAVNMYFGEYMIQYSWAEMTLGFLKKQV